MSHLAATRVHGHHNRSNCQARKHRVGRCNRQIRLTSNGEERSGLGEVIVNPKTDPTGITPQRVDVDIGKVIGGDMCTCRVMPGPSGQVSTGYPFTATKRTSAVAEKLPGEPSK